MVLHNPQSGVECRLRSSDADIGIPCRFGSTVFVKRPPRHLVGHPQWLEQIIGCSRGTKWVGYKIRTWQSDRLFWFPEEEAGYRQSTEK